MLQVQKKVSILNFFITLQEIESSFSVFASPSLDDSQARRALKNLTYEDVYWASKIENPLVWPICIARTNTSKDTQDHLSVWDLLAYFPHDSQVLVYK